jgi:addiction module RelE/StbE family toxin
LKKWLKSHPDTTEAIGETLEQLSADATHQTLRSHKLHGELAGCWSCSVDRDLRMVFEFVQHDGAEALHLLALGTHDQVY